MRSHSVLLLPILLLTFLSLSPLLIPTSLACSTCPKPKPPPPKVKPCPPPSTTPTPPSPKPPSPSPPKPTPPPKPSGCPIDILKLDACVDVLNGLLHALLGGSADKECCPVLSGLVGLDAGLCLCTAIRVKLLNINLVLPIALQVLVDCGKHVPSDFQCPS